MVLTGENHSQTSTISTFKSSFVSGAQPPQIFKLSTNGKYTISSRHDAAYPHKVIADPTGNFVLAPDLGADLIRLYSIDNSTGKLTNCGNYVKTRGTDSRHNAF
jgi:6-phosphogluconolactonase (cycloisomerase 2 family)